MNEILLAINAQCWELIKQGKKTVIIQKDKPKNVFYPFRVFVYVIGSGYVFGKFDCRETISTIRPELLIDGSCWTEKELIEYAAGGSICGWRIAINSIIEYETPIPLERATGIEKPPQSWAYLEGGTNDTTKHQREIAGFHS